MTEVKAGVGELVGSRSGSGSKRWYAVQAQPQREKLALLHLARQDFVSFCPMLSKTRRIGRKRVTALAPFFPGYLFVSLDLDRCQWRSINGTIGVLRLVAFGNGGRPTPLPVGFVERLQEWNNGGGHLARNAELSAGARVRIVGGPLDDLCGILETADGSERVRVLLSLLGKETRVQLRRDLLIAA